MLHGSSVCWGLAWEFEVVSLSLGWEWTLGVLVAEVPGRLPRSAKVHLSNPNPQLGPCSELATPPGAYPVCSWVWLQPVTPTREIAVLKKSFFSTDHSLKVCLTTLSPLLKYKPFKYVYIAVAGEPLSEQWLVLWSHQAKNSFLPRRMNTFLILLHPPLQAHLWTGFYHGKVVLHILSQQNCVCDWQTLFVWRHVTIYLTIYLFYFNIDVIS